MSPKIIYLFLLAVIYLNVVHSLRIKNDHFSHLQHHSFEHKLQHMLIHKSQSGHEEEIPDKVFDDLKQYVANDTEITNRIHAQKPLSKASADRVKGYFLENEQFKEFTLKNFVSGANNPDCLDNLDDKNKDKLFRIILDQVDFSTIFLPQKHQQQFTPQQVYAIVFQLKTDKDLCPHLQNCFGKGKH